MLPHNLRFEAIGTTWSIDTIDPLNDTTRSAIISCAEAFDATYSRFRADSLVTQVAQKAGNYNFPKDSTTLISFYRELYGLTDGRVTPLIGSMLERAGYDAEYSLVSRTQAALPTWDEVMRWDGSNLTTLLPLVLDVGAAGKGYLVDNISAIIEDAGITEYVVDGSGDLRHRGQSTNVVGLENPFDTSQVIGAISVQNESLCASSANRRAWGEEMHHIFDPHTMRPTHDIIATWVVADSTMIADGLATALFFTTPEHLLSVFKFEYVRMYYNGSLEYSSKFKEGLFA